MIAEIDQQADISIYLKENELDNLSNGKVIAGILIRIHKPESQGTINVQLDDNKKNINRCIGIGVDDNNYWGIKNDFELNIFIGNYFFNMLRENGRTGTRQSMLDGSKIDIYNYLTLNGMEKSFVETLEFYRDNKEKYQQISKSN
jgi:hypothetical protein